MTLVRTPLRTPRRRPWALCLLTMALMMLAAPAVASAAEGDPFLNNCTRVTAVDPCAGGNLGGTMDAELSPDGKQLYVGQWPSAGGVPFGISIYDRDPATGNVTLRNGTSGCYSTDGTAGRCTTVASLSYGYDFALTPDGESLYVGSIGNGNLVAFDRNPSNGNLTFRSCFGPGGGCTPFNGVAATPYSVIADNNTVYVKVDNALLVFTRDGSHALTQKTNAAGCLTEEATTNCANQVGLGGPGYQMFMTAKHLYVPSTSPGGIAIFNRSSGDGTLTQLTGTSGGCVTTNGGSGSSTTSPPSGADIECVDGVDTLATTYVTGGDPQGKSVYAGGNSGGAAYSRSDETGLLTQVDCFTESSPPIGCQDVNGGSGIFDIDVTPDGKEAIVSAFSQAATSFFKRNETTGALTQRAGTKGCFSTGGGVCELFNPLGSLSRTAVASNGMDLYVTSISTGLVGYIERDFAPTCQDTTMTVVNNAAAPVALNCSDPNGDDTVLAKVADPTKGTLAAIDQAANNVFYNPFSGFVGTDTFTFKATARGIDSGTATATLNVVNPTGRVDADGDGSFSDVDCNDNNPAIAPNKTDTPGNGVDEDCSGADAFKRIGGAISHAWRWFRKYTRVTTLRVRDVPAGATVLVRCKGKGCRFKSKKVSVKKTGNVNITKFFNFKRKKRKIVSKLKVKTKVTVQTTAPTAIGSVITFTVRRSKIPKDKLVSCLQPGTNAKIACS